MDGNYFDVDLCLSMLRYTTVLTSNLYKNCEMQDYMPISCPVSNLVFSRQ